MNIKIQMNEHNNRMLLLSAVELAMHAYVHPVSENMFVFENPLDGQIIKVRHEMHAKDMQTRKIIHDYKQLRQIILDNTEWSFNRRHVVELSVAIENYLHILGSHIDAKYTKQLEVLDRRLIASGGGAN